MTREEIVKALRACSSDTSCSKCTLWDSRLDLNCLDYAMTCAADLLEQDAPGWISVKDRLPEDGTPVIVLCQLAHHPGVWYRATEFTTHKSHMWHDGTARYWFPLPELPKEAAK